MSEKRAEFSFRTRQRSLERFAREEFDLLIIGGGITGAAVARDATMRGLKVALVEKHDFAYGTSSRSSKLIHGGLRYLQNMEFGLVFEALSERALLLKTAPHLVKPLPFFFPVYRGDKNGKKLLSLGFWLYDLLSLFRAPGFHQNLSKSALLEQIPFLKTAGLEGGFKYFDASMWDDVLAIEILRDASEKGAAVANYVEALDPLWEGEVLRGFRVKDAENAQALPISLRAKKVISCTGPWTDHVGKVLSKQWKNWIAPSKGVHLIFDLKRIPIPGAMVMSSPEDGRISFVIPRPDFGAGVVIVGTTDGPSPKNPEIGTVEPEDVDYLLGLLNKYFPKLELTASDILSAYVGVRPLMGQEKGQRSGSPLQKVSREHHIAEGPGGSVFVAGGKYTTHRKMAEEIVDFAIATSVGKNELKPTAPSSTKAPVNPAVLPEQIASAQSKATELGLSVPAELFERYGAEALEVLDLKDTKDPKDPEAFPALGAQLRFSMRNEMTMHIEDFYIRRNPFYASRADHGLPWAKDLAKIWASEREASGMELAGEITRLENEIQSRTAWQTTAYVKKAGP